jgi:hypothetical protein
MKFYIIKSMTTRLNTLIACFLFLVLLAGCEYNLDKENFRDISKPGETHQFDLSIFPELDTIAVFRETEFTYNSNSYGLEIKNTLITIDGNPVNLTSDYKKIYVDPYHYQTGYHILSITIEANSGSGSIADIAGYEGYKIEKKWVLYINNNLVITPVKTITKEGYLKITWPKLKVPDFKNYTVFFDYNSYEKQKLIYNMDSTSYIDSSYVGGSASFSIVYNYNPTQLQSVSGGLSLKDSLPQLKFEDINGQKLRVYWKKPKYNAMYKLQRADSVILLNNWTDTSVVINQNALGVSRYYQLYIAPHHQKNTSWSMQADYKYYTLGTYIATNHPDYGYSFLDNVFYTNSYDDVECYDSETLKKNSSFRLHNLMYTGSNNRRYAGAPNTKKIAVLMPNDIYVFSDKTLSDYTIIPYPRNAILTIDYFYLTDNDLIGVASHKKYDLISIAEKRVIATLNIDDYPQYSAWASISTSKDGKYVCIVTRNGIKIYTYETGVFTLTYSGNTVYRSVMFDSNNSEQLYLTSNQTDILEVRNINSFALLKSINLPVLRPVVRNIDPVTGYLFITDYFSVYLIDLNTNKTLFSCSIDDSELTPLIFNNIILSKRGYILPIAKFLNK